MKILHKMLLGPAVAIMLMGVVVVISFVAMHQQRVAEDELTTRCLPVRAAVSAIEGRIATVRGEVYRLFTVLGNFDAKRVQQERVTLRGRLTAIGSDLNNPDLRQGEQVTQLLARGATEVASYAKKADDAIDLATG
ncbi:MAG TPA: hypothetical protein VH278_13990, partial [Burkholderiaceae bacterium]|nr:hypothetical protein [Burkholderiaceae bacterium]